MKGCPPCARTVRCPSGHGLLDAEDEAVLRVQGSAHSAVGTLSCDAPAPNSQRTAFWRSLCNPKP